ncbi:MAG: FAD-dependent oxidoreductase, partial [Armatimonadetes bacterium]|nr:FAD-dependent oxidoreductase [Armatimonadota bacterium]
MAKVVVIGGGAGGMLAAGRAAECGAKVVLLERNSVLGKKLRITGKGRGNVTNTADLEDFVAAFGSNGKFLYSAFSQFPNHDLIDLLERLGVPTKVERGGRVFPISDRASDVAEALERWLRGLKVDIRAGTKAEALVTESMGVWVCGGVGEEEGRSTSNGDGPDSSAINHKPSTMPRIAGVRVFGGVIPADAVILATGGIT